MSDMAIYHELTAKHCGIIQTSFWSFSVWNTDSPSLTFSRRAELKANELSIVGQKIRNCGHLILSLHSCDPDGTIT
jgi:hypothetical protein